MNETIAIERMRPMMKEVCDGAKREYGADYQEFVGAPTEWMREWRRNNGDSVMRTFNILMMAIGLRISKPSRAFAEQMAISATYEMLSDG